MINLGKWKPRECSVIDLVRGIIVMIEAAAFEAKTQIAGGVVIMDLEGLSLNHVFQFTPVLAKTLVNYVQVQRRRHLPFHVNCILLHSIYFQEIQLLSSVCSCSVLGLAICPTLY